MILRVVDYLPYMRTAGRTSGQGGHYREAETECGRREEGNEDQSWVRQSNRLMS